MGKINQPFRRLLARISNEIVEESSEKADRRGRWRVSAGGHGCGGEGVVGNRWLCYGIETDGGGVDAELKYSCEIQWRHRDNCLTWTVQMEGWEEGMSMTWRGERNTVEKVNLISSHELWKSPDKQRQSVTDRYFSTSRNFGQLGNHSFLICFISVTFIPSYSRGHKVNQKYRNL